MDFSRPNKKIKYFSFKDFSRSLLKFNDFFKIVRTMISPIQLNLEMLAFSGVQN